jgi:hypothetical protein
MFPLIYVLQVGSKITKEIDLAFPAAQSGLEDACAPIVPVI